MSKTLILLAHPNIENSVGNKTVIDTVKDLENVAVRNLTALYPDFNIDVKAEHEAIAQADLIILQYPIYWYNMPPILKQWFDKVLTYGFAFGEGSKVTGKSIMASVTVGSPEKSYPEGEMERILLPLKASAAFCKLNYLPHVASYGIYSTPNQDEALKASVLASAQAHADKLKTIITDF
ncbi:MAG: NAD(P)H-dependent oxidoreductase [Flavobacteriaceae bacterium]